MTTYYVTFMHGGLFDFKEFNSIADANNFIAVSKNYTQFSAFYLHSYNWQTRAFGTIRKYIDASSMFDDVDYQALAIDFITPINNWI